MKLCDGQLIAPQNFQGLDKLETLELNYVKFSPDELKNLILNCTQLNELSIFVRLDPDTLKIHSNSLQCLKINTFKHLHLVAPMLHDAFFSLFSFQERESKPRFYYKKIEENFQLMEVMAKLPAKLSPNSTFDHLVNLSLTVIFGDMISEYALLSFMEKAKAVQYLEIRTISLQKCCRNIWEHVACRNSKFIFKQLLTNRFDALGNVDVLAADWIVCYSWVSGKKLVSGSHSYGGFWADKSLERKVSIPLSFVSRLFRCSLHDHNRMKKFVLAGLDGVHGCKSVTELVEEPQFANCVNLSVLA